MAPPRVGSGRVGHRSSRETPCRPRHNGGMPRTYSMGSRAPKASAAERVVHGERRSLRERFGGLRNVPPFLRLVWQTSPSMMLAEALLRFVRALLPVATLYVGKLIIDEVVLLAKSPHPPDDLRQWLASGWLNRILWLLA